MDITLETIVISVLIILTGLSDCASPGPMPLLPELEGWMTRAI